MLLRFRVINHKSIRDEAELSLVAPSLKTQSPPDGNWAGATSRVAAIYGANASGKSTLLDALRFLRSAVVRSGATSEGDSEHRFPYSPFRLDEDSGKRPSLYEVDFIEDDVRYSYGFETQRGKVEREWLYSYPTRKRRLLFERGADPSETTFGRSMGGMGATLTKLTTPSSLILSHGYRIKHKLLSAVRNGLVQGLQFAEISRTGDSSRVGTLRRNLIEDEELKKHVEALIRTADLGIVGIKIVERELSAEEIDKFSALYDSLEKFAGASVGTVDEMLEEAKFSVTLEHESSGLKKPRPFHLHEESEGTVAWLALVVPALHALRHGETLLIDEVGANLHPVLTRELIRIFKDRDLNPAGGQLVFTTHDTPLMGALLGNALDRDEVWFAEKSPDGDTSLYSLEEFSIKSGSNFEKRYLEGRFGAVPQIQDDELRSALLGLGV